MTTDFPYDWFGTAEKFFSSTELAVLKQIHATAKHLSVPAKTVLLEESKVADRLYLIRKGCLRLFFLMMERILPSNFSLKAILSPLSTAYTIGNQVFFAGNHRTCGIIGNKKG